MPVVSGGGGGLPAWVVATTATKTLEIDGALQIIGQNNTDPPLTVKAGPGGGANFQTLLNLEDDNGATTLAADAAGELLPTYRQAGAGSGFGGTASLLSFDTNSPLGTKPPVSEAATLALGTAYQHNTTYDVLLVVYLSVTVNTSGVLKLGVGPTATPTQQTLVTGLTATGLWPVPIYLPKSYFALLSVTGTITVAVDGQVAIPV